MNAHLDGIKKADTIVKVVDGAIERKEWRSSAEQAATAYLAPSERGRRKDVIAYVRKRYDAAGAGFSGRWQ